MTLRFVLALVLAALMAHGVRAQTPSTALGASAPDRVRVLRAAADALGMERWSDVGTGDTRLSGIDIVNTMDVQGSGTSANGAQMLKTDYHAMLGYNPAGMRVEMTRMGASGAAQHTIQTVRDNSAWDESEPGAGLVPGKGTATPMNGAVKERLLQLWTLPYGVIKAAIAAGDKTMVSTEAGATVITFPLSGQLAGVTVKATLDANNFITRVETHADNPALANLATQTDYSNYADRAEVLTDIKTPGHIVRRQGGRTILDIDVKSWETNNPYAVFPIPSNVKSAAAATSR
jgi:hypothetical protein